MKIQFQIPKENIVNGKFAQQEILEKTNGKGVNLIFNTLESTPFKLQSFIHTVAQSGRIVEFEPQRQAIESIGESTNLITSNKLYAFNGKLHYQVLLET